MDTPHGPHFYSLSRGAGAFVRRLVDIVRCKQQPQISDVSIDLESIKRPKRARLFPSASEIRGGNRVPPLTGTKGRLDIDTSKRAISEMGWLIDSSVRFVSTIRLKRTL